MISCCNNSDLPERTTYKLSNVCVRVCVCLCLYVYVFAVVGVARVMGVLEELWLSDDSRKMIFLHVCVCVCVHINFATLCNSLSTFTVICCPRRRCCCCCCCWQPFIDDST